MAVGISLAICRDQKGLSLENSEKSLKRVLGPRSKKKARKESKMTIFRVFFELLARFRLYFDFFFEVIDKTWAKGVEPRKVPPSTF